MKNLATVPVMSPVEFNLTVLSGKDKGAVYRLVAPEITIGRSSDNDISIPDDPTCSRVHARIRMTPEGFEVEGLSDKNSLIVDGEKVPKARLEDGSIIEVGNTRLQFKIVQNQMALQTPHPGNLQTQSPQHLSPVGPNAMAAPGAWSPQAASGPAPSRPQAQKKKKKLTPMRVAIYGMVALLVYILLDDPPKPKKQIEIRTTEQIQADIEAAKKLKEAAEMEKRQNQTETRTYKEAQAAYVRGFRDYQKGIFGRAMESFQACLSLVPDHQLCTRYLKLSQRRFNELTQYHMVLGRKYRDQNQFTACASAFSNVMIMIKDQNNEVYKEAKANYEACQAQVEDRF